MSEQEIIKMIESRTKEQIESILTRGCLGRGYRYYKGDYSKAKRIIFMGRWINSDIYDKQIKWICNYLGI